MIENSYWIVLLPLISAVTIFFFGRWLPLKGAFLGIAAAGWGLIHSLSLFAHVVKNPGFKQEMSMPWFRFGIYQTELGVVVDGLSALMLVIVTLVSLLVQIYSLGYMHDDPRFKRYYSYLSLFTFAMLTLVVANNFLQIFIGWELVGLASYLLIGFWFEKESAASAGRKAFITTKLGDLGFQIAVLMVFTLLGTLNFGQVEARIAEGLISPQVCAMIGILLFCGAAGKSAQVPLHIWLPDAMEGPTPVSALIHAATMVAAGVYMIARVYFVFEHGPLALDVLSWFGIATAFVAASMALVANDIKRVLAFSTVSQLGYMVMAMGVGGRSAGIFHLATHAFFKAQMFLAAGSVIHAVHTNDIQEMGGLSKKMVWTFGTITFAWLAICGVWPFAGFFSKDMILEAAHHSGHLAHFWLGVLVAFMTAFYMTRMYLLVFISEPRNLHLFSHAHESPASMVIPLVILAALSLASGLLFHYGVHIDVLLNAAPHAPAAAAGEAAAQAHASPAWFVPVVSSIAALAGIGLSFVFYARKNDLPEKLAATFRPVYNTLVRRYWVDEFFIYGFVKPGDALARALSRFDQEIFDRFFIDGWGAVTMFLSKVHDWFDRHIVDGLVNLGGKLAQAGSWVLRVLQTGLVQNYILLLVLGLAILVLLRLNANLGAWIHSF